MSIIYSVPHSHAVLIERMGKFSKMQREGLNFRIPFLENIKRVDYWGDIANKKGYLIELTEQQTNTPARQCQTKDNVTIEADAAVYWKIIDPVKAVYEVDILPESVSDLALNALRSNIGRLTLDEVLSERAKLNAKISEQLTQTADGWGIKFIRVEIQEINYSDETATAMMQQMTAERKKKAIIAESEGEAEAEIKKAEAEARALEIKANARAEALKKITEAEQNYLSVLKNEVGEERASKIIIAQKYIDGMQEITNNPANKVYLPNNFNGLINLKEE